MGGHNEDKESFDIYENALISLFDRASSFKSGLSEEDILNYFGLSQQDGNILLRQDEFPVEGFYKYKVKALLNNINSKSLIQERFVNLVENDIHYYKESKNWLLALEIEKYKSDNRLDLVNFADHVHRSEASKKYKNKNGEPVILHNSDFSKIIKYLKFESHLGNNQNSEKISLLKDFFHEKRVDYLSSLSQQNIALHLQENFKSSSLSVKEKKNIQGDYVFIRRANFLTKDDASGSFNRNVIFIGLLSIKIRNDALTFSYSGEIITDSGNPLAYSVSGFGIRDSSSSLKLIGFKNAFGEPARSLVLLALSVSVADLESGMKKYINGSVIEEEDSNLKPYHTWFHLSKISNFTDLQRKLNNSRTINYKKDFFYRFSFHDFKVDESKSDYLTIIRDHIKENYIDECPIKYIRNKLYMNADLVNVDIL